MSWLQARLEMLRRDWLVKGASARVMGTTGSADLMTAEATATTFDQCARELAELLEADARQEFHREEGARNAQRG